MMPAAMTPVECEQPLNTLKRSLEHPNPLRVYEQSPTLSASFKVLSSTQWWCATCQRANVDRLVHALT